MNFNTSNLLLVMLLEEPTIIKLCNYTLTVVNGESS